MNRPTVMDKTLLAAFADGELSPEEAAAVVMHLADHPQDQAFVDDVMASNAALARAFSDPLDEPVPEALRQAILGPVAEPEAVVVPFRRRPDLRRGVALWGSLVGGVALAAGLALGVFLPGGAMVDLTPGPLAAGGALTQMLSSQPSGGQQTLPDGRSAMVLATLPTPGGYCREVEVTHPEHARLDVVLACTEGADWRIEAVLTENFGPTAAAEGFAAASGDEVQSFTPFLDRIGAGPVLTPQDEAAAIAAGWAR